MLLPILLRHNDRLPNDKLHYKNQKLNTHPAKKYQKLTLTDHLWWHCAERAVLSVKFSGKIRSANEKKPGKPRYVEKV